MAVVHLLLLAGSAWAGQLPTVEGAISGQVVNRSFEKPVPCAATVVLCVRTAGQLVPCRETTADAQGRFCFDHLPVGDRYMYVAGANREGVHYPGPRVILSTTEPRTVVELGVHDAVAQPNPLVIRHYDILICPEPGAVRVTESLLIDNPTSTCYVGEAAAAGAEPVTLKLSIPADFERATFREEFYGRRFYVTDAKVATSIPWPPGQRELRFTYVLPNAQSHRVWERSLDLPCDKVCLRVHTARPDEVACELPAGPTEAKAEVAFQSQGRTLPSGHVLRVTLGRLPVPWMVYARWLAAGSLGILVAGAGCIAVRRRRQEPAAVTTVAPQTSVAPAQCRAQLPAQAAGRKHRQSRASQ